MNARPFVLLPLLALACQDVGLSRFEDFVGDGTDTDPPAVADTDPPADTDPAPDTDLAEAPVLDGVSPDFGTNAGGTEVTLTGEHLGRGLQVEFGGVAARVLSVNGSSAVVEAPAVSVAGKVTVKVTGDGGTDSATDAFRYWADAQGKVGALFVLDKTRFRGGYWTNPGLSWTSVYGGFLQPVDFEYWQLYTPTQGTCAQGYISPLRIVHRDSGAPKLTVTGDGTTVDLTESTTTAGYYSSEDLALSDAPVTRSWDLDPVTGTAWWPSFAVQDLLVGEPNFEVTSPAISNTTAPVVGRTFTLSWTGSGGDYMLVVLSHYTLVGTATTLVQEVTCSVPDNGQFVVPNLWTSWKQKSTDYINIQVGRIKTRTDVLPMDRSTVVGLSEAWVIGAADMN